MNFWTSLQNLKINDVLDKTRLLKMYSNLVKVHQSKDFFCWRRPVIMWFCDSVILCFPFFWSADEKQVGKHWTVDTFCKIASLFQSNYSEGKMTLLMHMPTSGMSNNNILSKCCWDGISNFVSWKASRLTFQI